MEPGETGPLMPPANGTTVVATVGVGGGALDVTVGAAVDGAGGGVVAGVDGGPDEPSEQAPSSTATITTAR